MLRIIFLSIAMISSINLAYAKDNLDYYREYIVKSTNNYKYPINESEETVTFTSKFSDKCIFELHRKNTPINYGSKIGATEVVDLKTIDISSIQTFAITPRGQRPVTQFYMATIDGLFSIKIEERGLEENRDDSRKNTLGRELRLVVKAELDSDATMVFNDSLEKLIKSCGNPLVD